jgi:hypothetical protein
MWVNRRAMEVIGFGPEKCFKSIDTHDCFHAHTFASRDSQCCNAASSHLAFSVAHNRPNAFSVAHNRPNACMYRVITRTDGSLVAGLL